MNFSRYNRIMDYSFKNEYFTILIKHNRFFSICQAIFLHLFKIIFSACGRPSVRLFRVGRPLARSCYAVGYTSFFRNTRRIRARLWNYRRTSPGGQGMSLHLPHPSFQKSPLLQTHWNCLIFRNRTPIPCKSQFFGCHGVFQGFWEMSKNRT